MLPYNGFVHRGVSVWRLALAKKLQAKSNLLESSPTPLTGKAEGKEASDVNKTDSVSVRSPATGQPTKALNWKQENALCPKTKPLLNEDMGSAASPNTIILREIDPEGTKSLTIECGVNSGVHRLWYTLLTDYDIRFIHDHPFVKSMKYPWLHSMHINSFASVRTWPENSFAFMHQNFNSNI